MNNAIIRSCGAYAPSRVVPNSFFHELLGEDVDAWLRANVEIYERRWCGAEESTADLCEHAARHTLDRAGLRAGDLDLIIVATDTPEYISPSTASVLQYRLGADRAGTFDVNTACAGFVTALDIGAKYIRADERYRYVLVLGAYAMSKHLNLTDKKTCTLFADGAGAVILEATPANGQGFLASRLLTQGQYHDWMGVYAGGARQPVDETALRRHDHQLRFVHKFPKELNPDIWTQLTLDLCGDLEITPAEVDHFFITQINVFSIRETMDRLGLPHERAHTIMHYYGYTGSACIPMAFNDAMEKGIIKRGETLIFIGSGGGLAFAGAAFRY